MSNWVVAVLLFNAALVVAVIVLALRIAGRGALAAPQAKLPGSPSQIPTSTADSAERPPLPLFTSAQMTRAEWRALLAAFGAARSIYVRERAALRHDEPHNGALAQARHDLEVAKRRLTRFEHETVGDRATAPRASPP